MIGILYLLVCAYGLPIAIRGASRSDSGMNRDFGEMMSKFAALWTAIITTWLVSVSIQEAIESGMFLEANSTILVVTAVTIGSISFPTCLLILKVVFKSIDKSYQTNKTGQ